MPIIEAHFLKGEKDTLVITFSDMYNSFTNQRFWGENVLRKCGFSAFGVTSNGPSWYPLHETIRALRHPVKIARSYKNVILYGYSMGAYAALKYSWLFNDPIVLAFSPQFSINPDDWNGVPTEYDEFYTSLNQDMKIEFQDVNGHGYIFYDPYHTPDVLHINRMPNKFEKILLDNCGHGTIHCISSSAKLQELIASALLMDTVGVRKIVSNGKRLNPYYYKSLILNLLMKNHAVLATHVALIAHANQMLIDIEALAIAADACKRGNDYNTAIAFYKEAFTLTADPKYNLWAADALAIAADVCKRGNDYNTAIAFYKEAFTLTADPKYNLWAADAIVNISD